jgi:hypothetical protein
MKYKIRTELSKDAVIKKISELLLEKNRLAGNVSDEEFKIRKLPLIGMRNSFLPVFEGKIEEYDNGCIVSIRARLHYFTSIFLVIWSLFFGSALLIFDGDNLRLLLVAILAIIVMLVFGFFIPAIQVIKKLKLLLK